jgi:hypothetical protein
VIAARRLVRWVFGVWALLALAGCSNSRRLPAPFILNTPGDVALACFDEQPDGNGRVVLPMACCESEVVRAGCPNDLDRRLRHALVTQTSRGEVAAVDLVHAKVLDSERRVPGYTFVDVGGLPAAIVVPPTLPGREEHGPPWTYVAGREVRSIRAIATCRFRVGERCGPEQQGIDPDPARARAQTELTLPEPPQDMLLDPDGKTLWVSLPKAALIARIELGELPADAEATPGTAPFVWPFATDDDSGVPRAPKYFEVSSGIALDPGELVAFTGDEEYRSMCGAGYAFEPSPAEHARAQPADSSLRALPTRMRLLPSDPGDSEQRTPVLFVADPGQAVLHAFAIVERELLQRGVLGVGAPLRDFALTAQVPKVAPGFDALVSPDTFAYETPPANDTRYLFGIDARDGSVMAFELSATGDSLALQPLVAPAPSRYEVDMERHALDRLAFEGGVARALEVVDTRYRALAQWAEREYESEDDYRDPLYCGELPVTELDAAISAAKRSNMKGELEMLEDVRDWTELGARSDVLRGVFLLVASSDGRLSVIDVHDLDLQCRARAGCQPGLDSTLPSDDSSASALALRRHARRVLTTEAVQPLVTSADELVPFSSEDGCPTGYYPPPDDDYPICVSGDPWQARNLTWNILYEGPLVPQAGNVLLERGQADDQLIVWGPQDWDFCARGANAADQLKAAIVSPPDPGVDGCETYSYGSEPELFVVEAHRDHLVLVARAAEGGEGEEGGLTPAEQVDEIIRCHPGFSNAELRLHEQFRVTYDPNTYVHRNHADETGECVTNEALDPRLTSRLSGPDWEFKDFALAFKLAEPEGDRDDIAPVIQLTNQSSFLWVLNVDNSSGRADALPSRVRFFPGTDDLFVVDGASQGLRRYELEPFQHDGERFR